MIKPNQIKAARAMLDWSRGKLSEQSGIHLATIRAIENGEVDNPRSNTLNPIIEAFEANNVEFIDDGVQLKKDMVRVLEGDDGVKAFYNDVASTAEYDGGEFLVYGVNEDYFVNARKKLGINDIYRGRMKNAKKLSIRVIISADDENKNAADYCTYRKLPNDIIGTASPFYIYGDNLAHIIWADKPQFIIISNKELVASFRRQFDFMWEKGVSN